MRGIRPVMRATASNRSKSLQELDGADWGDPRTAETPMIGQVLALRRKPLKDLSDAERRLAVSQKVGLPFILGFAMERLSSNPLLEGEHYPGDILAALLRLDDADWAGMDALRVDLSKLFQRAMGRSGEDADDFRISFGLLAKGSSPN